MAVITKRTKRSKRQQQTAIRRVLCSIMVTVFLIVVVLVLYEIDSGFRAVRELHKSKKITLTTDNNNDKKKNILLNNMFHNNNIFHNNVEQHRQQHNDAPTSQIIAPAAAPTDTTRLRRPKGSESGKEQGINENVEKDRVADLVEKRNVEEIKNQLKESNNQQQQNNNVKEEESLNNNKKDQRRYYLLQLANLVETNDTTTTTNSTSGIIILETRPDWAPLGVEHFHSLLEQDFYVDCRFFRVIPDFMVQFGIHGNPTIQRKWRQEKLLDDPVLVSNTRGTISYAMSGPNTRTTQLFINTRTGKKGNAYLDQQGFSPIARILYGMDAVDRIYSEAREKPIQPKIQSLGNTYLQSEFPLLSYIQNIQQLSYQDILDRYNSNNDNGIMIHPDDETTIVKIK